MVRFSVGFSVTVRVVTVSARVKTFGRDRIGYDFVPQRWYLVL